MPNKTFKQILNDLKTTMTNIENMENVKNNAKLRKRIANQVSLITNSINHQNIIPNNKHLTRLQTHLRICRGVVNIIHKESLNKLDDIQKDINLFSPEEASNEASNPIDNKQTICYSLADSAMHIFAAQLQTMPDDKNYQEKKRTLATYLNHLNELKSSAQSQNTHKDIHIMILDKIHDCLDVINRHTNPVNSLISTLRCRGLWRTETHIVIADDVKDLTSRADHMLSEINSVHLKQKPSFSAKK